jgi:hypothetical protein
MYVIYLLSLYVHMLLVESVLGIAGQLQGSGGELS